MVGLSGNINDSVGGMDLSQWGGEDILYIVRSNR